MGVIVTLKLKLPHSTFCLRPIPTYFHHRTNHHTDHLLCQTGTAPYILLVLFPSPFTRGRICGVRVRTGLLLPLMLEGIRFGIMFPAILSGGFSGNFRILSDGFLQMYFGRIKQITGMVRNFRRGAFKL